MLFLVGFAYAAWFTTLAYSQKESNDEAIDLDLQQCFEHVGNRWLVGFTTHLTKVRFKDDCLRECLKAQITHNFTCNSAMYLSSEGECILSQENRKTQPDLFTEPQEGEAVTVHYFENTCTLPRMEATLGNDVGSATVHFNGYRGVLGYFNFAQRSDEKELTSSGIIVGLDEDKLYTVEISKETDWIKGCSLGIKNEFKVMKVKGISQPYVEPVTTLSKEVFEMKSDAHNVYVMARKHLPMSLYDPDRIVGSMLSIWPKGGKSPVACGVVKPLKNLPEAMANVAVEHYSKTLTLLVATLSLLLHTASVFF
ncbi:PAN 1 domain containing protein [Trichuris trichiura]|uniref:PAN 1 domain containing protein n=1 Tax=Trichuris trichiura TaxID=36087 RepID=A0A077Z0L9_TRITR|nr:PAN 1 domain containing protein [Trichuris trichiura]